MDVSEPVDPYRVLGLTPDASREDIRRAYRRLARSCHPDTTSDPGATARFRTLTAAYERLRGNARPAAPEAGQAGGAAGGGHRGAGGTDIELDLPLSIDEARRGCDREIEIVTEHECTRCDGTGAPHASALVMCQQCGGLGRTGTGAHRAPCFVCGGEGQVIRERCRECGGTGTTVTRRTLTVALPPGVTSGTILEVPGEGTPETVGGAPGAILLHVQLRS